MSNRLVGYKTKFLPGLQSQPQNDQPDVDALRSLHAVASTVMDEHFGAALEEFDLDFEDLEKFLGPQLPRVMWGCAF